MAPARFWSRSSSALSRIGGPDSGRADLLVRDHLLKNIFGFEYLIAPYTIAHLKLSQYLKDQGHTLENDERLCVYLTNTLEPIEGERDQRELWPVPALAAEIKAAQAVKEQPILAIIGNPPYSVESRNTGEWITSQIEAYKFVDGAHFGERKHSLNDDYVKFIRFAQLKMDEVDRGVVGVITNRRFIENVTFRGMRQSLLRTFDQIYVLDLGGASGSTYEGGPDENVFEITVGVAVTILAKTGGSRRVRYFRVGGTQIQKYEYLVRANLDTRAGTDVDPTAPNYFFVPHSILNPEDASYSLREIFGVFGVGLYTARDSLTIAFTGGELSARIDTFSGLPPEDARQLFKLGPDVQAWSVEEAQEDIKRTGADKKNFEVVNYRPFDKRLTYYTGRSNGFISRPGHEVMRHLRGADAPSLVTCRLLSSESWSHTLVTDRIIDNCYISSASRERAYAFPLYLESNDGSERRSNLTPDFRAFLDKRYDHHYTPEEILGYIYAVLHAPSYRTRYAEHLRIDFPHIPFPETQAEFDVLSKLGWALVQAHLLRKSPSKGLAEYHGKGDHAVEAVRYDPEDETVWINKTQCFKPVSQPIWKFQIGGYQVVDKYLKSHRGRKLSLDEINHVAAVAAAVAFTIEQMAKIDETYRAVFPERG